VRRLELVRTRLTRVARSAARRRYVGDVDSISDVRSRHPDFEAIEDRIRGAGTDDLDYFAYGYTHEGGLALQQNPTEFAALILHLREDRPHRTYMEIGSASGGACSLLSQEVGFETVLSLDDGRHPRAAEQEANFSRVPGLKRFVGDSHSAEARVFLAQNVEHPLDIAFIDGDHSFRGVWQDLGLSLEFCRPGSFVVLHDTVACSGVERAWLQAVRKQILKPVAEFIGEPKPLGIAVGVVPV